MMSSPFRLASKIKIYENGKRNLEKTSRGLSLGAQMTRGYYDLFCIIYKTASGFQKNRLSSMSVWAATQVASLSGRVLHFP